MKVRHGTFAIAGVALAASWACGTDDVATAPADAAAPGEAPGANDATASDATEPETIFVDNFSDLEGRYEPGEELGDWTVLRAEGYAAVARASDQGLADGAGGNVLYFSEFSSEPRFRESRIDRCAEIDADLPLSFSYEIYADVEAEFVSNDLRVRVNPNFYTDIEACEDDVRADSTQGRLEEVGSWYNEDWDVRLESARAEPAAWFRATEATHNAPAAAMRYAPEAYPSGAGAVRFSLRVRDDQFSPVTSRRLYLRAIELTQP